MKFVIFFHYYQIRDLYQIRDKIRDFFFNRMTKSTVFLWIKLEIFYFFRDWLMKFANFFPNWLTKCTIFSRIYWWNSHFLRNRFMCFRVLIHMRLTKFICDHSLTKFAFFSHDQCMFFTFFLQPIDEIHCSTLDCWDS